MPSYRVISAPEGQILLAIPFLDAQVVRLPERPPVHGPDQIPCLVQNHWIGARHHLPSTRVEKNKIIVAGATVIGGDNIDAGSFQRRRLIYLVGIWTEIATVVGLVGEKRYQVAMGSCGE